MTSVAKLKRMKQKTSNVKKRGFRARKINRRWETKRMDAKKIDYPENPLSPDLASYIDHLKWGEH
jgi:hypothetical protein